MTAAPNDYEPVIGLEVHVQLGTASKLFCPCENTFGAAPNENVCETCTGQPGALPAPNREAIVLAIRAGLALECAIAQTISFDRKNYFYPDLPKGYQITQLARPIVGSGGFSIDGDDGTRRRITIVRAHLEEDAGKTIHPEGREESLVDFNRAGVPLLEIVSAPEIRSPSEASRFLTELRSRLRYARVSECDMEKGTLRCDANVSVRRRGDSRFGTRVEIKNLNSFRNIERALEHEITRQVALRTRGDAVIQETRSFDADSGVTATLRRKEEAEDYRYFPDPDLPEFAIPLEVVAEVARTAPESAAAKSARYATLGLDAASIANLVRERDVAEFFDRTLEAAGPRAASLGRALSNFVLGPVLGSFHARGASLTEPPIPPAEICALVGLVEDGALSGQAARTQVLEDMANSRRGAADSMRALGLEQVSDVAALDEFIETAIGASPKAVAEYRAGKSAALNALVGAVMKASRGKANPNLVRERLVDRLSETS